MPSTTRYRRGDIVKIFDPGKSKGISYLCAGFAQVYQYTKDYNTPFGYLN